jgi:4-aminobutyrate aminotransferase-like enzyme/Ser/Thr protein kinase RdoA (MazF antagonist)
MASLVQKAPRFTSTEATRLADELYDLQAHSSSLPSERDQNFLLRDAFGEQFVLKIANAEETFEVLDLQNQAIRFLSGRGLRLEFPRIIATRSGKDIGTVTSAEGQTHFVRLLSWVDGTCLAKVRPHGREMLRSLGQSLAEMDTALAGFDHPGAHRVLYWDLRQAEMAEAHVELLPEGRRAMVTRCFLDCREIDWNRLRSSVVHNDASDYNVLVASSGAQQGRVNAIVDFGDLVYTATVSDLAVALAYVMLEKEDPIGAAAQVIAAYQETYPLTEREVDALYTLVRTRLALSAANAAYQTREVPQNEYLSISNHAVWALLEQLAELPTEWVKQMFRYACGLPLANRTSKPPGRSREDLLRLRRRHLGPALRLSYNEPLHVVSSSRQYLYDAEGRRYLDCVNNVAHVGHCHPSVVRAAADQMATLNTNTRYLYDVLYVYVERLTATLPKALSVIYLVCSGSEANELALRLARSYTSGEEVVVVDSAYHGNTSALVDISPYKFDGPDGRGCPPFVHKVPLPDVYRGPYRGAKAGTAYAEPVAAAAAESRSLAAFFCESALSCGGQIPLPPGYLREAYAAVRAEGGVCVADEIQTGFGRPGSHFWMFETQGVVPDIVTLGKPMANGFPLGAVVTTAEIAKSLGAMEYFNTFGGNPVSCAAGLAVLDVLQDEELQQSALETGKYLQTGLEKLKERHPLIGDVRGAGLFLGLELVRDRHTQEPADREAERVVEQMRKFGVLLSIDGPFHNVIKIKPPLAFARADADLLLHGLDAVLEAIAVDEGSRHGE